MSTYLVFGSDSMRSPGFKQASSSKQHVRHAVAYQKQSVPAGCESSSQVSFMPSLAAAGRRTTGEAGVTELVQGGASSGNTSATATTAATTAAGGTLPALPTAATAAAAAAAAAIAGLGTRAAGEGAAPGKPGASHPLTGLSRQKQVRPLCAANDSLSHICFRMHVLILQFDKEVESSACCHCAIS